MNPQYKQRGALDFRVLVALGAVMIVIFGVAYFFYGLQPSAIGDAPKDFQIMKGEGFRTIGADLSQQSLIKSITVFKLYSLLTGNAQKFQPGSYTLSGAMSVPQIVGTLTEQKRNDVLVVIPEGSTMKDIDAMLASANVLLPHELDSFDLTTISADYPYLTGQTSLEGFLFPDSYYFETGSSVDTVVRRMLDNFSKKAWPLLSENDDWYHALTLASFLEREVIGFDDRQIVAGILLKRLSLGMPLQVDATVSYAKCNGLIRGCENLIVTRSDLSISSPYNTYGHAGWTPTPIANPGEIAIKAALSPIKTNYLYYLSSSKTKETHFSRTLEEHNNNRVKYL